MSKIRKIFGIGRKPKKRDQKAQIELPENYIVGSTNQDISVEGQSKSDGQSKADVRSKSDAQSKLNAHTGLKKEKVTR